MILEAPGRAALALTVAGCLGAQQQQHSVVLKTTARLVQVSVLVHDRKGPVADLKK